MLTIIEFKKIDKGPGPPIAIRMDAGEIETLVTPYGFTRVAGDGMGEFNSWFSLDPLLSSRSALQEGSDIGHRLESGFEIKFSEILPPQDGFQLGVELLAKRRQAGLGHIHGVVAGNGKFLPNQGNQRWLLEIQAQSSQGIIDVEEIPDRHFASR